MSDKLDKLIVTVINLVESLVFAVVMTTMTLMAIFMLGYALTFNDAFSLTWTLSVIGGVVLTIVVVHLIIVNFFGKGKLRSGGIMGFRSKKKEVTEEHLEELYYRGEITKEEFEQMKKKDN